MGRWVYPGNWYDTTWRLAARDEVFTVTHFRTQASIEATTGQAYQSLLSRALKAGTKEWSDELSVLTSPEHLWCYSDACAGSWSFSYTEEWGCDPRNGADLNLGRFETWFFTDRVSALEFKLRWC